MKENKTLEDFLANTEIDASAFAQINIKWEALEKIGERHEEQFKALETIGKTVAATLHDCTEVHSVKSRVKTSTSVMEKVARKKIERLGYIRTLEKLREEIRPLDLANELGNAETAKLERLKGLFKKVETKIEKSQKWDNVDSENYLAVITDLVGVRALHLYSSDCIPINLHIQKTWDKNPSEEMLVFVRKGDEVPEELEEHGIVEPHPHGYRSVHHIIQSKPENKVVNVEIQVRTIFQEGWSEIHHRLTYKKANIDTNIEVFLNIFNLFAGGADVMGSYARDLSARLDAHRMEKEASIKTTQDAEARRAQEREALDGLIDELAASTDQVEKADIKRRISEALSDNVSQRTDTVPFAPPKPMQRRSVRRNPSLAHKVLSLSGLDNSGYLGYLADQKTLNDQISDALGAANSPLVKLGINSPYSSIVDSAMQAAKIGSFGLESLENYLGLNSMPDSVKTWLETQKLIHQYNIFDTYRPPSKDNIDNDPDEPEEPEPVV